MWYLRVVWLHDFDDQPIEIFSEVGVDDYERRKVERFPDARLGWADESHEVGGTGLGEVPVGPIEDINAQPEFLTSRISAADFEHAWTQATCES